MNRSAASDGLAGLSNGATHPGCVRELNEDNAYLNDDAEIWAVADGMGGHARGDYASAIVVEYLQKVRSNWPSPRSLTLDIEDRLEEANAHLRSEASRQDVENIGATVVCLAKFGDHALIVWAGDSRVYLQRGRGDLKQVTRDHTIVQDLIDAGRLDPAEAEAHPMSSVITRAVGAEDQLTLDYAQLRLMSGDRLLLCSDGLTRIVGEPTIARVLERRRSRFQAADALIELTLEAGAPDNVTVFIVDIV